MPWLETAPMEQRARFIDDWYGGLYTMTELCARYGVTRKTGYKWLGRFDEGGRQALADRSRAPHHCPHRMAEDMAHLICDARRQHPSWGPAKLLDWLRPRHSKRAWPAVSTAGDLLARHALVKKRRRRRTFQHPGVIPATTAQPNDLWTADFKGHFRTGDGVYCSRLTMADHHTGDLLACQALRSTKGPDGRRGFEQIFRQYGLPRAIRTDNGVPRHDRDPRPLAAQRLVDAPGHSTPAVLPARPQQNGADERMHKTLKAGAIRPPRATLAAQQRAFTFRRLYNDERPHDFLDGRTPGALYRPSPRPFTDELPPIEYPGHFIVKRVTNAGTIRFKHRLLFVAHALTSHPIGLEEVDDGVWSIYFCQVLLGRLDEPDDRIRP